MIIKIENIPEGQKIKSISFSIDFESGASETVVEMPINKGLNFNKESYPIIDTNNTTGINETTIISEVDISKRPPKVDDNMLTCQF